ncbi:MAG: tyrosine-type recombinase/integrase [Anaerolineae bacterium]
MTLLSPKQEQAAPPPGTDSARWLEALVERFEAYLTNSSLRPATIRNYVADVRGFVRWMLETQGNPRPQAEHFQKYRNYLASATEQSTATVNRRLQALRILGRYLVHAHEADVNPAREIQLVRNLRDVPAGPRVLDYDEIERLIVAVRAGARPSLMRRDYAIIELMLQAGLRVNEVATLDTDDIALTGNGMRLIVRGAAQDHYREVPLNDTLSRALREYIQVRPNMPEVRRLFVSQRGQPLSMRSIQRLVESYAQAAQLDDVCANSLRHTCAKKMLDETHAPHLVAEWLGHKNVESLNRYR